MICKVQFKSIRMAQNFVLAGKPYVDWLPYENTKKRADIFFRSGSPFMQMPDSLHGNLIKAHVIRNALVHSSGHSKSEFDNKVIGSIPLSPRDSTPIGFLRSQIRISPIEVRFETVTHGLLDAAKYLCIPGNLND